ncbi:MAG: hypothetical protein AAF821_10470 [Cyanobacteria bacterium P01_D01_bin.156]
MELQIEPQIAILLIASNDYVGPALSKLGSLLVELLSLPIVYDSNLLKKVRIILHTFMQSLIEPELKRSNLLKFESYRHSGYLIVNSDSSHNKSFEAYAQ